MVLRSSPGRIKKVKYYNVLYGLGWRGLKIDVLPATCYRQIYLKPFDWSIGLEVVDWSIRLRERDRHYTVYYNIY
jgi:hypothetical protein